MSIMRVTYRERQRLTAADLRAEQEYRLGLAGRHHLTHHQWGVVRGLRVLAQLREPVILTPGVAIDGYGREIVVGSPVELSVRNGSSFTSTEVSAVLSGEVCWDVFLYYCESPEQVPPHRVCRDDPAPRIRQHFTWAVVEAGTIPMAPSSGDDLARAQAAGRLPGLPPWPVLVARVGRACWPDDDPDFIPPLADYSRTRYVRHRAGLVRSPTGRAALQLGLTGRTDVYHFAVSTRDDGRGLVRRVAIDRDGAVQVWRPLVISGAEGEGAVAFGQGRMLRVSMPTMPAGPLKRVRIDALLDPSDLTLTAALHDGAELRARERPALTAIGKIQKTTRMKVPLRFGRGRIATFELLTATGVPSMFVQTVKKGKAAAIKPLDATPQKVSVKVGPAGGKLMLREILTSDGPEPVVACDDVERSRPAARAGTVPVVLFRPAKDEKDLKTDPLAREFHAVTTSQASDPVAQTELRLSGGAEDESDASSRLSVGSRGDAAAPGWAPLFVMDGGRRLAILPRPTTASAFASVLQVDDTVYLPPIRKDDPLLPDMLAMAFVAGLRQVGPSVQGLTATVTLVSPRPTEKHQRGQTLEYDLTIGWSGTTTVKHCLETITGITGNGAMAFRKLPNINPAIETGNSKTYPITIEHFTHPAAKVRLQIQLLAKRYSAATGVVVSLPVDFELEGQ